MGLGMARAAARGGLDVVGFDTRPISQFGDFAPRMITDPAAFASDREVILSVDMSTWYETPGGGDIIDVSPAHVVATRVGGRLGEPAPGGGDGVFRGEHLIEPLSPSLIVNVGAGGFGKRRRRNNQ